MNQKKNSESPNDEKPKQRYLREYSARRYFYILGSYFDPYKITEKNVFYDWTPVKKILGKKGFVYKVHTGNYSPIKLVIMDFVQQIRDHKRLSLDSLKDFSYEAPQTLLDEIQGVLWDYLAVYPFDRKTLHKMLPEFRNLDLEESIDHYLNKISEANAEYMDWFEEARQFRNEGELGELLTAFLSTRSRDFNDLKKDDIDEIKYYFNEIINRIEELHKFGFFRDKVLTKSDKWNYTMELASEYYDAIEQDLIIQADRNYKSYLRIYYKELEKAFIQFYEKATAINLSEIDEARLVVPGLKFLSTHQYLNEVLKKGSPPKPGAPPKFHQHFFIWAFYMKLSGLGKMKKYMEDEVKKNFIDVPKGKRLANQIEIELRKWIANFFEDLHIFLILIYRLREEEFPYPEAEYYTISEGRIRDIIRSISKEKKKDGV